MARALTFRFLLCLLLCMALSPVVASAQPDRLPPIQAVYGFDREFPPFSYEVDGQPTGFEVELLQTALEGRNVELQMIPMDWQRVQLDLSGGSIQLTSGMVRTPQREMLYDFSQLPTAPLKVRLYTRNENRVGNVIQLRGKAVAVEEGSLYERIMQEFGGLNIKTYPSEHQALRALAQGEVDAFGGADKTASYYVDKLGLSNVSPVGTPLETPELKKRLDEGMWELMENGRYVELFRKWFVRDLKQDQIDRLVQAATAALINAYAPYSQDPNGAAVLGASGTIYTGINVENRQPSLTGSALRVAIHNAISNGETVLRGVVSVDSQGSIITPGGDDLQVLYEFGQEVLVITQPSPERIRIANILEMMPYPYGVAPPPLPSE
ncbi:MAG: cytidine deaminase [Oceanidesulfovibrio sp.]